MSDSVLLERNPSRMTPTIERFRFLLLCITLVRISTFLGGDHESDEQGVVDQVPGSRICHFRWFRYY